MNVSVYKKGHYGELCDLMATKNKANSKPIAGFWPDIQSTKLEIRRIDAD